MALRFAILVLLAFVLLPVRGEDWTVHGKDYHNVKVDSVDGDKVSVEFDGGVGTFALADLSPELQKRFNYPPPEAATAAASEAKASPNASTATTIPSAPASVRPDRPPMTNEEYTERTREVMGPIIMATQNQDLSPGTLKAIEGKLVAYQRDLGDIPATASNMLGFGHEFMALVKQAHPTDYADALKLLLADPAPEIVAIAQREKESDDLVESFKTRPMELKFTAVDGREVDLAKMRGKVVLIEFWASTCPGCQHDAPNSVIYYQKYHDQGLEIVGISSDYKKEEMLAFIRQNGIVWPQYFDNQDPALSFGNRFNILAVPLYWLVDKKGLLVSTEAHQDLEAHLEALLQAP